MNLNASIVFQKTWDAINKFENGKRKYTIIIHEGSSRSSKTWSIYQALFLYGLKNKRKRIVAMRDTKEDCRDKVEPGFKDWYSDPNSRIKSFELGKINDQQLQKYLQKESLSQIINENKSYHSHTIRPSNSYIEFTGANDDDKTIGKSQSVLWVNEPYVFDETVFNELEQRTSDFVIIDWNPRFKHWVDKLKLRDDCAVIHSTFLDNPFLGYKERDGLLRRKPLDHKYIHNVEHINFKELLRLTEKKQVKETILSLDNSLTAGKINEIICCWGNEKQKTADKYRWEVYGLGIKSEKPNKIYHGWEQITEDFFDKIQEPTYYGLDMGITSPTACIAAKWREGYLYLHQHVYKPGEEISSLGYELNKSGVDKNRPIICDRDVRGTEQRDTLTILELHNNGYQFAMPALKGKGSAVGGIEAIQKCRVFTTNTSHNIWDEYYGYEWAKYNGQIIDQPVKKNDHAMDAIKMAFNYMRIELGIIL